MNILKNRHFHEIIIFAIALAIVFFIIFQQGYILGSLQEKYLDQHLRLFDYLRQSYFETGQLFPQMTTNLGGIQSFSSLMYYGYVNPLIFISYIFPHLSTIDFLYLVAYFVILASFITMNLLLRSLNDNYNLNMMFSIIYAFSTPLLYHLGMDLMFIYFFPLMPLSLYAIKILVDKKIMWLLTLCTALIFYFNFYYIISIILVQILFFIAYYFFYNHSKTYSFKSIIIRLIPAYLIGIMIGFLPFLPQFISYFTATTQSMHNIKVILTINFYEKLLLNNNASLLLIPIFSFILALFNRKDRFSLFLIVTLLLSIFLLPTYNLLNYNINDLNKVIVYYIPLFYVIFVRLLSENKNYKKLLISLLISIMIVIFTLYIAGNHLNNKILILLIISQVLIVLLVTYLKRYLSLALLLSFLVISLNFIYVNNIIPKDKIKIQPTNNQSINYQNGFYRVNNDNNNLITSMDEMDYNIYVSIPEDNWLNFNEDLLLIPHSNLNYKINNNPLYNNIFGQVKLNTKTKQFNLEDTKNTRPFIYGVSNKYVYQSSSMEILPAANRAFALNQGIFVDDSKQSFDYQDVNKTSLLNLKKPFTFDKKNSLTIDIPTKYQNDGFYEIIIRADKNDFSDNKLSINDDLYKQFNMVSSQNIKKNVIYYPAHDTKKLVFKDTMNDFKYNYLVVNYVSNKDFDKSLFPYTKTSDNKVDTNQSLSFKIDMAQDGYLATSIPFNNSFIIKANDKILKNEKIDGYFLGSKLKAGTYNISIEFAMPGFKLGAITTVIGGLILAMLMVNEISWLNKSFFRFVIVGVINTVNYFIMYTILLNYLPYLFSHIGSFLISALISYFLTSYYTFKTKPTLKTFIAFPLTFLPNLIFSTIGTTFLIEMNILSEDIASVFVMLMLIPITFIINKIIFIRKNHSQEVQNESN